MLSALPSAGGPAAVGWAQNTQEAAGFASAAVLTCANALATGIAFNFAQKVLHPKPPWPLPAVEAPSALVQAISTCPRVCVPLSTMTLAQAAGGPGHPRSSRIFIRAAVRISRSGARFPHGTGALAEALS
jgi:hypothetical protein